MSMRRAMIERESDSISVRRQCELLSLHRSGLYYTPSTESEENLAIMETMDKQYLKTPFYVVGWSLSNTMTSQWCIDTIQEAIEIHGKPEIINSDQGSQFTCEEYVKFLNVNEIMISMDGKGRAIDNVFIERLWRSVKYEHVYLFAYENGKDLWHGLDEYFKFYNEERPHQSLENRPPKALYFPPPNQKAA